MSSNVLDFELPTDPDSLKRIKQAVMDASAQTQMIDDRKENIKEIRDDMKESFDMPPSFFNKLVRTHYKQNYEDITEEHSKFEMCYESIMSDSSNSNDGDDGNDDGDED